MTHFGKPTTPAELSPGLRALIESIVPDGSPDYVDVAPLPEAPSNECVVLVEGQVNECGGEMLLGWAIWEFPTLFVEAEFHAVWKKPDQSVTDITPKASNVERVLFLPDRKLSYEGRQINNIRRPLKKIPALLEYLETYDLMFELMNRGVRAEQHGEIHLSAEEMQEHNRILEKQTMAFKKLLSSLPRIGPYHPCPCGSGRKVKWCHGVSEFGS